MSASGQRVGADSIVETLESLGVEVVFGVPGSQNVWLFESLRRSRLRTVVATDEMAASFMAGAYARVTGGLAVLTTIPGPGFTFALTGLAEAQADSAAVLYLALTVDQASRPFTLQLLPQRGIAGHLSKRVLVAETVVELGPKIREAAFLATSGEPGPVLVDIASELLAAEVVAPAEEGSVSPGASPDFGVLEARLAAARRPLFFLGQGARPAEAEILGYAEAGRVPIATTCSGRGIVPETHPLVLYRDFSFGIGKALPAAFRAADLVVAIGCKLSYNGTGGFELPFAADRTIHIDRSAAVLASAYCGGLGIEADAVQLGPLLKRLTAAGVGTDWTADEVSRYRQALAEERVTSIPFPPSVAGSSVSLVELFGEFDRALPHDRIVTTDSGHHQGLVRSLTTVHRPAGLLAPADFQAMGFGIPAAIAAKIADPAATVVACIGDGGFAMMGTELLTAIREGIDLIVVVFNNGSLGLIANSQLRHFGHHSGTKLLNPDFELFAAAVGAKYHAGNNGFGQALESAKAAGGVHLIELELGPSRRLRTARAKAIGRQVAKRALGGRALAWIRELLGKKRR